MSSPQTTVTICGREYRIGATYRPKRDVSARRKTLLRYRTEQVWPFVGPSVQWRNRNGSTEWENASAWHKWVGDEMKP